MDRLNDHINSLGLSTNSRIGLLGVSDSISIMAMPGGEETVFFDGIRDKNYQVQINAKSKNQNLCFDYLTVIYQNLERLESLESSNNSFDFQKIEIRSLPNFVGQDEQGFFIWALSISAKITIYGG